MTNEQRLAELVAINYLHRWAYTDILNDSQKAQFSDNQTGYTRYQDEGFRWLKQAESIENSIFATQRRIITEMTQLDSLDLRLRLNEATGLEFNFEDVTRIQSVLKRITEESNG